MSDAKKDGKLSGLTMKEGSYPPGGKPFYYCPTSDCGECHGCTTGKKLDELVRPDLSDEEFEEHLMRKAAVEGEVQMVVAGSLLAAGNGRSYQVDTILKELTDLGSPEYKHYPNSPNRGMMFGVDAFGRPLQRFNKVGISRHPMLPIGNNWLHKSLITGGGFRSGELAMIAAGAPDPLNRFKSNWLANYVSDFVARGPKPVDERSILQLFAEPEITGGDYYQRLRNLVNATRPVHMVRVPGGTRPEKIVKYIGATDHSSPPPSVQDLERFVDPSPFIEVKGWGIWVGGKKILSMPFTMQDMMIDSITERYRMRGRYGAYGQFDARDYYLGQEQRIVLNWPAGDYEHATKYLSPAREDWAEDAIDKLIHLRIYGEPKPSYSVGLNRNVMLVPTGALKQTLEWNAQSRVKHEKEAARARLQAASNPERQKRGY